ncbi:hypothetical protein [Halorussus salinisoli]|uniref:hypothetical protein n=1 Tax=Halorussus salinisoli TaxID=2558242 RepID=UPI0014856DD0|nr:hypothetical protein [Halorussus salinisoli]
MTDDELVENIVARMDGWATLDDRLNARDDEWALDWGTILDRHTREERVRERMGR